MPLQKSFGPAQCNSSLHTHAIWLAATLLATQTYIFLLMPLKLSMETTNFKIQGKFFIQIQLEKY